MYGILFFNIVVQVQHGKEYTLQNSNSDVITIFLTRRTKRILANATGKKSHPRKKKLLNHNIIDTSRISLIQFGPPILILIV